MRSAGRLRDRKETMNTYTHGHHESVLRSHRMRSAANSAAYLLPHLHETDSLLDIGAGPAPSPPTWPAWSAG